MNLDTRNLDHSIGDMYVLSVSPFDTRLDLESSIQHLIPSQKREPLDIGLFVLRLTEPKFKPQHRDLLLLYRWVTNPLAQRLQSLVQVIEQGHQCA
jgi:hypothetical protein